MSNTLSLYEKGQIAGLRMAEGITRDAIATLGTRKMGLTVRLAFIVAAVFAPRRIVKMFEQAIELTVLHALETARTQIEQDQ